jgi:putative transposase
MENDEEIEIYRRASCLLSSLGRVWHPTAEDILRIMGISKETFQIWKKKYGELGASEGCRLRQLEEENLRLKRVVADLTLDKNILQEVIKKDQKPSRRRRLAQWIRQTYGVANGRACNLARLSETACYYAARKDT